MNNGKTNVSSKRRLLAMTSGIAGLATAKHWVKPVVESVVLPVHATTSMPPAISGLSITGGTCVNDPLRFSGFNIVYDFTSGFGVVSHVIDATCGDDTLQLGDGSLGNNLLGTGSFSITGDEFSGQAVVAANSIAGGADPLSCSITVTLRDANGGETSDSVNVSETCELE